nr:hypothetical protein [uncultured Draconibacterium sp.]
MKRLFYISFMAFVLISSCNKEEKNDNENQTKDELTIYDKNGTQLHIVIIPMKMKR